MTRPVVTSNTGVPTDGRALVKRYRAALADALAKLDELDWRPEADEIALRHGFVYVQPKPEVRLSLNVPPAERVYDEHTR